MNIRIDASFERQVLALSLRLAGQLPQGIWSSLVSYLAKETTSTATVTMSANSSTDENDPLASASTGHDHLTALPLELLNSVSSYLWPDHDPDLAFHPERRLLPCCHSLD